MLIIRNPTNVFDTEEIQRGTLIYAKHKSWSNGERGFVVSVTGNKATVQYPPQIGNFTNHFFSSDAASLDDMPFSLAKYMAWSPTFILR